MLKSGLDGDKVDSERAKPEMSKCSVLFIVFTHNS